MPEAVPRRWHGIFADILEIRRTRYGYEKEEQNCDNIFEMITHGFVV